jgi:predicted Zn-dependent peptidase
VLGPPAIVAALPRATLVDYMASHYTAPRMILGAAGRLDHDVLVKLVEASFGAVGAGAPVKPAAARYAGGDRREVRSLEQAHLVLALDGVGYHDPGYYALAIASTLLGGGMSSRLFQEIREKRGLVYSIYSFTSAYEDGGLFGVYAGTGEDGLRELVPVLCDELVRATSGVGEDELARAKAQIRAGIVMSLESTAARAEQLARQISIYGRVLGIEEMVARVEAVDRAAVVAAIAKMLSSRPTVAAVGQIARLEEFDAIAARLRRAA